MSTIETKKWDNMNEQERMDSINLSYKIIIATACKEKKCFWDKNISKEEIDKSMPYNPKTAEPYRGITAVVLQTITELNGYKTPQFLTMKQANTLGGKLKKELDTQGKPLVSEKTGKEQYVTGIRIPIKKEYELVPKTNTKGEAIIDEKTNKPILIKEYLKEPVLETVTLYHISQFDGIQKDKLKEKNLENINKQREIFSNTKKEPNLKALYALNLLPHTKINIENFLQAATKGKDYEVLREAKTIEKKRENNKTAQKANKQKKPAIER